MTKNEMATVFNRSCWLLTNIPGGHTGLGTRTRSIDGVINYQIQIKKALSIQQDMVWHIIYNDDESEVYAELEKLEKLYKEAIGETT